MIHLTYRWSDLDKKHQFGIELVEGENDIFYNWFWFYLGQNFKHGRPENMAIYPFISQNSKIIGKYNGRNARNVAKCVYKRMIKKYGK